MPTPSTDPIELDAPGAEGPLEITWSDGHRSSYDLLYLRRWCPCAECTNHGATPTEIRLSRDVSPLGRRMNSIEEVGSYAVRILWGDGHSVGIYSFEHLRTICPCAECKPRQNWTV